MTETFPVITVSPVFRPYTVFLPVFGCNEFISRSDLQQLTKDRVVTVVSRTSEKVEREFMAAMLN